MNHIRLYFLAFMLSFGLCSYAAEKPVTKGKDYLDQGYDLYNRGQYHEAMTAFIKGMETAEEEGDRRTLACCAGYISNIYSKLGDLARCYFYLNKGYAMAVEDNDSVMQGNFLSNMVAVMCKMGNAKQAREAFDKLAEMPSTDSLERHYYLTYNSARIAKAEGNQQDALRLHRQALDFAKDKHLATCYQLFQLNEIAQLLVETGSYEEALTCSQLCLDKARELGDTEMKGRAYQLLAEVSKLQGDSVRSDMWHTQYLALTDSLFSMEQFYKASGELMDYENRQTNRHISQLNTRITEQWVTIMCISGVVVALALLAIFLIRANRRLHKAHQLLVSKNKEIMESEQRSRLLRQQTIQQSDLQKRVTDALDDMDVLSNPNLSLNLLAESVGSNTKYVSQIVNDTYGKTFKTLLNERRIQEACRRLTDTEHYGHLTIQAVYESVGYTNAVSFIRAFKKVNGMTPSEYQRAAQQMEPAKKADSIE